MASAMEGLNFDPNWQQNYGPRLPQGQNPMSPQYQEAKPWEFNWLQPQGAELRQQGMNFAGINAEDINKQAAIAGQQQREQNVAAYNAALASQRGVNPTAAAMGMGQNLANVNAQTAAGVQNIQAQNTFGAAQANQNMLSDYYRTLVGAGGQQAGIQSAEKQQKSAQKHDLWKSLLGGITTVGAGAALAAMSDEREKEPVNHLHERIKHHLGVDQMAEEGEERAGKFVETLSPQSFKYKEDSAAADGGQPHLGIMAQNLEKTPEGKSAVIDTPEGKKVDVTKLSLLIAAGLGHLNKRLEALEGGQHGRQQSSY